MNVAAIIAAGGSGRRVGASLPKQLLPIGNRTMLQRSLDAFDADDLISEIVVVVPADQVDRVSASLEPPRVPHRVVPGGARRQDSVANGFEVLGDQSEIVVVHDAARPLVTRALIERTIRAAVDGGAAVPAVALRDTVKQTDPSRTPRTVQATLPREALFLAQTPQAFRRQVLRDAVALGQQGVEATDEATLAERAGHVVHLVEGDPVNIKVTSPDDLAFARWRTAGGGAAMTLRTGIGYDLHRLVPGRPLVLGGVRIPHDRGALGHSDADALCHAVTDAILGAAGAGDIGRHFPDSDPRWKNASSLDLLRRAAASIRLAGGRIENVDAVVILERPRIGPYVAEMAVRVGAALAVAADRVSIKGKTNEGLGEIGRGEAIAVQAVSLVSGRALGGDECNPAETLEAVPGHEPGAGSVGL